MRLTKKIKEAILVGATALAIVSPLYAKQPSKIEAPTYSSQINTQNQELAQALEEKLESYFGGNYIINLIDNNNLFYDQVLASEDINFKTTNKYQFYDKNEDGIYEKAEKKINFKDIEIFTQINCGLYTVIFKDKSKKIEITIKGEYNNLNQKVITQDKKDNLLEEGYKLLAIEFVDQLIQTKKDIEILKHDLEYKLTTKGLN